MANNKEEAGKGMPCPGEMPASRRPYATIDVRATEVEGREPPAAPARPSRLRRLPRAIRRQGGGQAVRASAEDLRSSRPRRCEGGKLAARSHRCGRVVAPPRSSPTWRRAPSAPLLVLAARAALPRTTSHRHAVPRSTT